MFGKNYGYGRHAGRKWAKKRTTYSKHGGIHTNLHVKMGRTPISFAGISLGSINPNGFRPGFTCQFPISVQEKSPQQAGKDATTEAGRYGLVFSGFFDQKLDTIPINGIINGGLKWFL